MTTLDVLMAPTAITTLPTHPGTAVVLCDADDTEVPATREVHYEVHRGTPDAAGRAIGVCDSAHCLAVTRAYVEQVGDLIEVVRLDGRVQS